MIVPRAVCLPFPPRRALRDPLLRAPGLGMPLGPPGGSLRPSLLVPESEGEGELVPLPMPIVVPLGRPNPARCIFLKALVMYVVAFINLRISEGHLRQLMPTQGQRGLGAARRTATPEIGLPI